MVVTWHLASFEESRGGLWGQDTVSEGEAVGDEVKRAGRQILHIGSESHCEDFGCYSGCDGNLRKTECFTCCIPIFMFFELCLGV